VIGYGPGKMGEVRKVREVDIYFGEIKEERIIFLELCGFGLFWEGDGNFLNLIF
jgi:hypothetical protein